MSVEHPVALRHRAGKVEPMRSLWVERRGTETQPNVAIPAPEMRRILAIVSACLDIAALREHVIDMAVNERIDVAPIGGPSTQMRLHARPFSGEAPESTELRQVLGPVGVAVDAAAPFVQHSDRAGVLGVKGDHLIDPPHVDPPEIENDVPTPIHGGPIRFGFDRGLVGRVHLPEKDTLL